MKNTNTLIKISPELKKFLNSMKLNENDSYNDVLWNFFEPFMERSKESLERSRVAAQEYEKGKVKSVEEVFNINEFDKEIFSIVPSSIEKLIKKYPYFVQSRFMDF